MGKKSTNNGFTVLDADKYAPTTWGKTSPEQAEPFEHTTASGQLCLIRRIGMGEILKLGFIEKFDFFTASISEGETAGAPAPESDASKREFAKKLLGNFDQMEETINSVILVGVIAPIVHAIPAGGRERSPEKVYVDSIPFEDRVELFGEILDTEGLSSFRQESEASVGDVPADESVQDAPV